MTTHREDRFGSRRATLAAIVSLGIAACGRGSTQNEKPAAAAATTPTVEVVRVVDQPVTVTLSMPAELNAYQTVAIYPRVTGFLKSIVVDRGSRVRAGQVLATLDAPELVAQRSEAQSKLRSAEAQLGTVRSKAEGNASTYEKLKAAAATPGVVAGNDVVLAQKAVEADQGQIAAAQQNVEAARQALKSISDMEGYLRVTAPFAGVVTERNVHPGALVGPSTGSGAAIPMVRLVENDRLRLVVPVPEAYTAGVAVGTEMSFAVAAYPGETFNGRVARIAQAVDVSTRTMAVQLDVANADGRLAPGAFCQVRWPVRRTGSSLLVPSDSVASTTDRTFVVRIRNGHTEWIDVKTGLASGPLTEVFGDLRAGDQIAMHGTDEIRPGTEVHIKEVKPAA
jgi:membrane fusion protein (multidrug efflux system)